MPAGHYNLMHGAVSLPPEMKLHVWQSLMTRSFLATAEQALATPAQLCPVIGDPACARSPSEKDRYVCSWLYDDAQHSACRNPWQTIEKSPSGIMLVTTEIMHASVMQASCSRCDQVHR